MTEYKRQRWVFITHEPDFSADWDLGLSLAEWLLHEGDAVSARGFGAALPRASRWLPGHRDSPILVGPRGKARRVLTARDPALSSFSGPVEQIITTNPTVALDTAVIPATYLPYPVGDEYFETDTMAAIFEMTRIFRLEHRPRVVFVGDYGDGAGLSVLFAAARTVLRSQGELVLLNGLGFRDQLAPVVKTLGLEEVVIFLPRLSAREESAIFNSADLCVDPSTNPAWFPAAALRAMATRLPIVAWETPLMTALSDRGALLVDPQRDDAWAPAMKEAMENQPLRERMMERARTAMDLHRMRVVGNKFRQITSHWHTPSSTKF